MAQVMMLIHEENKRFGASFPDFPGCTTVAGSPDELMAKAATALVFHVDGMIEAGESPHVRSIAEIWNDPQFQSDREDALLASLLDVELPAGKTVRVNISFDEAMLDRLDQAAQAAGESRSGYLMGAAKARMNPLSIPLVRSPGKPPSAAGAKRSVRKLARRA